MDEEKEIDIKFFRDFAALVREHIEPKSQTAALEIKNIVKSVCRSHGWRWSGKCECRRLYGKLAEEQNRGKN
jgi:hypothetical protein